MPEKPAKSLIVTSHLSLLSVQSAHGSSRSSLWSIWTIGSPHRIRRQRPRRTNVAPAYAVEGDSYGSRIYGLSSVDPFWGLEPGTRAARVPLARSRRRHAPGE